MVLRKIEKRLADNFDWSLAVAILGVCAAGLVVLYSAGHDPDTNSSVPMKKQAISMGLGIVCFLVAMCFHTSFWRRSAPIVYAAGVVLLVVILLEGVVAGGARRWLDLGAFRMQPSEFMKIGIILFLARILSSEKAPEDGYTIGRLLLPAGVLVMPFLFTLVQPDLGTALCQVLVGGSMILLAGVRGKTLLQLAAAGALAIVPAWSVLKPYQRNRILTFLSPELDPLGSGYHAIQSKIAVGSGALTGKGLLEGTQTQLRFLPEQTTDFIFSVLAEEWGFVGSIAVILLYFFLITRLLKVCSQSNERFQAFVCFGVAALVFWQVVINIGMVTGVLPVVGITLPLLSYGGSSVMTIMISVGIVAGVSTRRFLFASRGL